eukprot:TRINITY_DN16616_c0_g1_i2.p1 TRINITY_DN16616_c0_g1~~TRINITY_DN16616_c0_g1_i2.p1  ORF type:complete len:559 (-),score=43.57 TRINITY_DN16616_c0_g1_i2:166-1842(-)
MPMAPFPCGHYPEEVAVNRTSWIPKEERCRAWGCPCSWCHLAPSHEDDSSKSLQCSASAGGGKACVEKFSMSDDDADDHADFANLGSGPGSDRGFLLDQELEQWLSSVGLSTCDIPMLEPPSKKKWDMLEPRILRYGAMKSDASWSDFQKALVLQSFRTHLTGTSNQGRLGQYVKTSQYMDEMRTRQATELLGSFNQSFGETGILGLEKALFDHGKVAPEYLQLLHDVIATLKFEESAGEIFDIMAASRHGLNFHVHSGFWFMPMRGKKLFIVAPSGAALSSLRPGDLGPPEGLRFADLQVGLDHQMAWDLRTLPAIALLQKYTRWLTHTPGLYRCLVKEGDILMIPARWWHLTLSVGDSLSLHLSLKDTPKKLNSKKTGTTGCAWKQADFHDWDETTYQQCVKAVPKSKADVCRKLPPPPSSLSSAPTHLCDVIYRFLSWRCREDNFQGMSPKLQADAVIRDAATRYEQNIADGGREAAEVFVALTTVWAHLARAVGRKPLAKELFALMDSAMASYSKSTHTSVFVQSDSVKERLTDPRSQCQWVWNLFLADDSLTT